jgi:cbb3-type cytochrome oxidase maturation protein
MEIVFVLIPISIVLILGALWVFSWAIDSGQFEDLDREAQRILLDEEAAERRPEAPREPEPAEERS